MGGARPRRDLHGPELGGRRVESPFAPGDAVVAYTDGASEARDADGNALCTDGLRRLVTSIAADGIPPTAWPATVLRRVASHRDEGPEDDILVLALFRPAQQARPAPEPERRAALSSAKVMTSTPVGRA